VLVRLGPYAALAALGLVFFAPLVLHPGGTFYADRSDLIAEHVPAKVFLVREWRATGELPLWRPDQFGGAPLVHDVQVGLFYPPHWILFLLPPEGVGPFLSWMVVAHVVLAGWCMYGYARAGQGLTRLGAFVAALGYMFAGKWLSHLLDAGHYILAGLAWLPLALWLLESAVRRVSLVRATAAGAASALLALGTHPQWTFYAGLLLAAWTLGAALESAGPLSAGRTLAALGRWAGLGAWAALTASALCAVQLLPTLEAAGQSSRAGGTPPDDWANNYSMAVHQLVGPSPVVGLHWEFRGGLAVIWLMAAALAPLLCGGRTRWQAGVWVGLMLLGVVGGDLLQAAGFPAFRNFRIHARVMVLAGLPLAVLAGATTDALFAAARPAGAPPRLRAWAPALALAVAAAGAAAFFFEDQILSLPVVAPSGAALRLPWYRGALVVLLPAAVVLLLNRLRPAAGAGRAAALLWVGVLLADLWAAAWPLVDVRDGAGLYTPPRCVAAVLERRRADAPTDRWRVLDCGCDAGRPTAHGSAHSVLGAGDPLASVHGLESAGGYSPLDVRRYRSYLQFIDDAAGPVVPLEGAYGFPVLFGVPVRNKQLADLLGVRYLFQPRDRGRQPQDHEPAGPPGWERVPDGDDPAPRAYNFVVGDFPKLPAYEVWKNPQAFPRAFVVSRAAPLPPGDEAALEALKRTDLERVVLLEDWRDESAGPPADDEKYRTAAVTDYRPNRVALTKDGPGGWLVLADVWFPGWTCTVNGRPAAVRRADYVFRAVAVPDGPCDVVFTFEPESYFVGRAVSAAATGLLAVLAAAAGVRAWARARRLTSSPAAAAAAPGCGPAP
jgi:hypothetical protein